MHRKVTRALAIVAVSVLTLIGGAVPPAVHAETLDVTAGDNFFSPEPIVIAPGTTVVWTNRGKEAHTVTSDDGSTEQFDSKTLAPGTSFRHTFNQVGAFTYHCVFHDNMLGTIIVQQPSQSRPTPTPTPAAPLQHPHHTVFAIALNGTYRFSAQTLRIKAGTRVTWKNVSIAPHTITSKTHIWTFSKNLGPGKERSFVFKRAGIYRYYCRLHAGMIGTIVVHR